MALDDIIPFWRIIKIKKIMPFWRELIHDEYVSRLKQNIPLRTKLWAWRRGFLSESFVMYELDHNNYNEYLTDYTRTVHSGGINGRYREMLADKLLFSFVMARFYEHMPHTYGYIHKGIIRWFPQYASISLENVCQHGNGIVLKPIRGGSGAGITFITTRSGVWYVNGKSTTFDDVSMRIGNLHDVLIDQAIEQAEYSSKIFPKTSNSIRLLTMWDVDTDHPFIAAAVHRFGTEKSFPVDNMDAGGLSALIDVESGTMGPCASYPFDGRIHWHDCHPDTALPIAGTDIPHWDHVAQAILDIARAFPNLPYVGWDILLENDAIFKILEANHRPSSQLIQIHRPLLRDPKVRRFYEHHCQ